MFLRDFIVYILGNKGESQSWRNINAQREQRSFPEYDTKGTRLVESQNLFCSLIVF